MKIMFKNVLIETNFNKAYDIYHNEIVHKKRKSPNEEAFLKINKDIYVSSLKRIIPIGAVITIKKPFILVDPETVKKCGFSDKEIFALLLHEHHHVITKSADEKAADGAAFLAGYGEDLKSALRKMMEFSAEREGVAVDSVIINNMCLPQYHHRVEWLYTLLSDEGKEEFNEYYQEYANEIYSEYLEEEKTTV